MSVIPCILTPHVSAKVDKVADLIAQETHLIPGMPFTESELYDDGLLRGAIERLRGRYAATMAPKREFMRRVLDHMMSNKFIRDWESAGEANRHDYTVTMPGGKLIAIELKGCLDGNNTNIFERPPHAQEFYLWSICTNVVGSPRKNVWSGIHTRLSAEIISRAQQVDGLVVWDWICGSVGRPCPKIVGNPTLRTEVAQYDLVPPCIYLFPPTIPHPRTNPNPAPHTLGSATFLDALFKCFKGTPDSLNEVEFEVKYVGRDTVRRTTVSRNGAIAKQSNFTPIKRT